MKQGKEWRCGAVNWLTTEMVRVSWSPGGGRLAAIWQRLLRLSQRAPKRLRLCESLPLGERRFIAVVEFERARFLVGGTPSSLVLLSRLEDDGGQPERQTERAPRAATAAVGEQPRGRIC